MNAVQFHDLLAFFGYTFMLIVGSLMAPQAHIGIFGCPTVRLIDELVSNGEIDGAVREHYVDMLALFKTTLARLVQVRTNATIATYVYDSQIASASAVSQMEIVLGRAASARGLPYLLLTAHRAVAVMSALRLAPVSGEQDLANVFVQNHDGVMCRVLTLAMDVFPPGLEDPRERLHFALAVNSVRDCLRIGNICRTQLDMRTSDDIADVLSLLLTGRTCVRNTDFPLCTCASDVFRMYSIIACRVTLRPSAALRRRLAREPVGAIRPLAAPATAMECLLAVQRASPALAHLAPHVAAMVAA